MLYFNKLICNTSCFFKNRLIAFYRKKFIKKFFRFNIVLISYMYLINLFYPCMNPYLSINSLNNISLNFFKKVDENIKKENLLYNNGNYNMDYGEILCRLI